MIDICDIMRVPAEDDHEHWPVNKFQHILAHFSDQVRTVYVCYHESIMDL